jgi:hypothetical protein
MLNLLTMKCISKRNKYFLGGFGILTFLQRKPSFPDGHDHEALKGEETANKKYPVREKPNS